MPEQIFPNGNSVAWPLNKMSSPIQEVTKSLWHASVATCMHFLPCTVTRNSELCQSALVELVWLLANNNLWYTWRCFAFHTCIIWLACRWAQSSCIAATGWWMSYGMHLHLGSPHAPCNLALWDKHFDHALVAMRCMLLSPLIHSDTHTHTSSACMRAWV